MNDKTGKKDKSAPPAGWRSIGTVVGNTSTDKYSFILKSFQAKLGDIVVTRTETPGSDGKNSIVSVWGRIISIGRFNPFFPSEAAQELADENIRFMDTVLAGSRDHLEADVLILGATVADGVGRIEISPLTYPIKPSAEVFYPKNSDVKELLTGGDDSAVKLHIGTLIARGDVDVSLSANQVVSRHLAILAMTGGGKTVAARRIIRALLEIKYPLIVFDPHGDYLGFYEKQEIFKGCKIQLLYPMIRIRKGNVDTIQELIEKMGRKLTEAQGQFYGYLINNTEVIDGDPATKFIERLIIHAEHVARKKRAKDNSAFPEDVQDIRPNTINAVRRSLEFVRQNLEQMERNNERLRRQDKFKKYEFKEMPDPDDDPEGIVRPGMLSIFYLAGYDHVNQSAIVSIVMESLFAHRSTLNDYIPPFQAVIEEAHNFIPSRQEGLDETPSLKTIRKVITEGRKFGTGLILISQRPSRLDETTLAQCNSFLVLRLVNPKDKNHVRSVMENLSESDANILQTFGPGQGIVSGQAVRFPLLVKVKIDNDLKSNIIGDEDFIADAAKWKPNEKREKSSEIMSKHMGKKSGESAKETKGEKSRDGEGSGARARKGRRARMRPRGF